MSNRPLAEDCNPVDALRGELDRGHRLDRAVARHLGRPEPERSAASPGYLATLEADSPLPDAGAERALVAAAQAGDAHARAQLVAAFLPLIASVARTYRSGHVQRVELLQEGVVGLLRALERFEPGRGVPFWGYAAWWVRQAMQQLVAELTRPVVLSDRALRHLARLRDAHDEALRHAGREPDREQLAARSGLRRDQVDALLATEGPPRSLEEPVGDVGALGDLLADPLAGDAYEQVLDAVQAEQLHALLAGLSERERHVLRARFGLDGEERSRREIGAELGLSGERVRQIEQRALAKLSAAVGG